MIKFTELESVFADSDIIINKYSYETDEEIDLPYLVYDATSGESFGADGISFFKTLIISLAVIDESPNFFMQRKVEEVLDNNTVFFDKSISFDDNSRLYTVIYTFSVVDNASD